MDDVGAITRSDAAQILNHSHVTIRPVIDLEDTITATGYVAPPRLKEQTALRNGSTCTFPSWQQTGHNRERKADTSSTADGNHSSSTLPHQPRPPGVWLWTSPTGRMYLVTGGTTTELPGRGTAPTRRRRKHHAA